MSNRILDAFKHVGEWIFIDLLHIVKSQGGKLLDHLKDLAIPIAEAVSKRDLNGDGRVDAAKEIVDALKKYQFPWALEVLRVCAGDAATLASTTPTFDIQRYLAVVMLIEQIEKSLGGDQIPALRILNGIIETAVNFIQERGPSAS